MNRTVTDALRRAASLTRAGSPMEATRAIQAALNGTAVPPAPDESTRRASNPPTASPNILDLTATRVDRAQPAGTAPWESRSDPGLPHRARFARPLAETIRDLAAARRVVGSPPSRSGPPPVPEGARYLSRSFDCVHGSRDYRLYIPAAAASGRPSGLVMMLHGCKQDPDDFATGTGMNAEADATGMIVVYPAQTAAANPSRCWNWFSAADQRRGAGEAALLAALAGAVAAEFGVGSGSVFVAGLSAGGAMAAILAEAYPDVFSAAGIHSGLPAGAASDLPSAFAAMAGHGLGAGAPAPTASTRLIVFHGTADTVVRPANGEAVVETARRRAQSVDRHEGRTAAGRTYRRIVYRAAGGHAHAEHWILDGHGHAWSGGRPEGSYTDREGPGASAEMMRFFAETAAAG
jgi:poly(hydroxyalkanoate) depolymerase family esterase